MENNSQSNQFIFNLPSYFIPRDLEEKFKVLLEKNRIIYDTPIDYLNSCIKGISIPGYNYTPSDMTTYKGKKIYYKTVQSTSDLVSSQTVDVIVQSKTSALSYILFREIYKNLYLATRKNNKFAIYEDPFIVTLKDVNDSTPYYKMVFREVLFTSISEYEVDYSKAINDEILFTLSFNYNFLDEEFLIPSINPKLINPYEKK